MSLPATTAARIGAMLLPEGISSASSSWRSVQLLARLHRHDRLSQSGILGLGLGLCLRLGGGWTVVGLLDGSLSGCLLGAVDASQPDRLASPMGGSLTNCRASRSTPI